MLRFVLLRLTVPLIALLSLSPQVSAQPSFDCARAGTSTEHAICGSESLAALDRDLATAYSRARGGASAAQADAIRADQGLWLGRRNDCGGHAECLENMMRYRLDELRRIDGSAGMRADLTGLYCPDNGTNLTVVQRGGRLEFSFGFFASNGHACGSGRLAGRRSGNFWVSQENGCEMVLRQVGGDLVLTAMTPGACKDAYCGFRAAINELRVPLSSRNPHIADLANHNWFEDGC